MEKRILQDAQDFRLKCYRRMLLIDGVEDYAIQDYQEDWCDAQKKVKMLFAYLDSHDVTPEEEGELLLTIFVGLRIGFRNSELMERATDRAFELLPQLPQGKLLCHLLVFLYDETEDEAMLEDIDHLFSSFPRPLTQEDRYLQETYRNTIDSIPYRMLAV